MGVQKAKDDKEQNSNMDAEIYHSHTGREITLYAEFLVTDLSSLEICTKKSSLSS